MSVAMSSVAPNSHGPAFAEPAPRLRHEAITESERNFSIAIHLSTFTSLIGLFPFSHIAPLVLWLVRKQHSAFNDDHGREMMNVMLTAILLLLICLPIVAVGWLAYLAWVVVIMINQVRAAIAAGRGEYFRYPMTIRFLK